MEGKGEEGGRVEKRGQGWKRIERVKRRRKKNEKKVETRENKRGEEKGREREGEERNQENGKKEKREEGKRRQASRKEGRPVVLCAVVPVCVCLWSHTFFCAWGTLRVTFGCRLCSVCFH